MSLLSLKPGAPPASTRHRPFLRARPSPPPHPTSPDAPRPLPPTLSCAPRAASSVPAPCHSLGTWPPIELTGSPPRSLPQHPPGTGGHCDAGPGEQDCPTQDRHPGPGPAPVSHQKMNLPRAGMGPPPPRLLDLPQDPGVLSGAWGGGKHRGSCSGRLCCGRSALGMRSRASGREGKGSDEGAGPPAGRPSEGKPTPMWVGRVRMDLTSREDPDAALSLP